MINRFFPVAAGSGSVSFRRPVHATAAVVSALIPVLLCLSDIPVGAATTAELRGRWPGYPRTGPSAIEIVGDRGYMAVVNGLAILDIADPAGFEFLGKVEFGFAGAVDVALSGNQAALCFFSGNPKIRVVDVTDPQLPVETVTVDLAGNAVAAQMSGQYVYCSRLSNGLAIIDLEQVGGIPLVGIVATFANGRIELLEDRGYLPTNTGLEVYRFVNPTTLTRLGTYNAGVAASAVAVVGDRAYLAAADGLHILDITATTPPTNPTQLGFYSTSAKVSDVRVEADRAYIACDDDTVKVLDITSASNPVWLGEYAMTGHPRGLGVRAGHGYILNYDSVGARSTMESVDLTDPTQPTLVETWESAGNAVEVRLDGSLAYLADGSAGLSIVDVQVPTSPTLRSSFSQPFESVLCLDKQGDIVGVGVDTGLRVVNVSDPSSPTQIGFYSSFGGLVNRVRFSGQRAYLVSGFGIGELEVVSLADPSSPVREGGYMVSSDVQDLEVHGATAFLAEGPVGMEVVDCTDPSTPVRADLYEPGANVYGLHVVTTDSATNVFVATADGLDILNAGNPSSVGLIGHWGSSGLEARHVFVEGTRTFLQGVDTSWILDTTDPGNPLPLGEVAKGLGDLVAAGDLLYSPLGDWGLEIHQVVEVTGGPILLYSRLTGTQLRLDWSEAGTGWDLQYLPDLSGQNSWQTLDGSGEVTQWDLETTGTGSFFRLKK